MKYWILTTEYPPQFGGGIGTYCFQWSQILRECGTEVTVFLLNKDIREYRESNVNGIRIVEFSPLLNDHSAFVGYETGISLAFEKIVSIYLSNESHPDWIEAQEYNGIAYYLLQKKMLGYEIYKDVKVLINCHCPSFIAFEFNHISTYQLPYFWIGEMERFCLKAADVCISPSQYLIDTIVARHPYLQREFHVLKNPFIISSDIRKEAQEGTVEEIVFLGKLSPIKGILQTLRVFARLWNDGWAIRLNLIGDDTYYYHSMDIMMGDYVRKNYGQYISKGLLKISGALNPQRIADATCRSKIVLVPSTFDNFPYTVVEMMSLGKLVIASSTGGHTELIRNKENGLIFNSGSEDDMLEKIKTAINYTDSERRAISEKAFQTIKDSCNPIEYANAKLKLLREYMPRGRDDFFPFLHSDTKQNEGVISDSQHTRGLLSIVIPYYNMGSYIDETLDSIRKSDYSPFEIIIINDGSTDEESLSRLDRLIGEKNIRIVHQQNKGLSAARNYGAQLAQGEFIAFLDADDKISENYYSTAIKIFLTKANVHFVGCWTRYFDQAEGDWPAFTPEPPYILYHNMVNSSSVVYRTKSFLEYGLNDSRFVYGMEDYDSILSMVSNNRNGVVIPDHHFYYRVRKGSMARGFNKSNMAYTYQMISEKHREFYTKFAAEIAGLLNTNGPGYLCENPTSDENLLSSPTLQKRLIKKVVANIKRNPKLRKIALRFYRLLKFNIK